MAVERVNIFCTSYILYLCDPRSTYSQFIPEGVLANILGIVLVLFGVLLGYLITREEYRRPPNPEEESLSVHFKTLTEGQSPTTPWPQMTWQPTPGLDTLGVLPKSDKMLFSGVLIWFSEVHEREREKEKAFALASSWLHNNNLFTFEIVYLNFFLSCE